MYHGSVTGEQSIRWARSAFANHPVDRQWKAFDFFQLTQVKLGDQETRALFENNEISSVCSGSESLFLGSDDGHVRIIGPSWKVLRSFHAHETGRITHMRQVDGTSLLVTVSVRVFRSNESSL